MEPAGDIFDERGKKYLALMLRVMFLGKHPVHMNDLDACKTEAGVEFGKKRKHIPCE
jgi:hypothetical protein